MKNGKPVVLVVEDSPMIRMGAVDLMARPSSGSAEMDPARRLCCALARCCWFVARPDAQLLLSITGVDAWVPLAGG